MEISQISAERQRAIEYLERLGIDVWLLKSSADLLPSASVSARAQNQPPSNSTRKQSDNSKRSPSSQSSRVNVVDSAPSSSEQTGAVSNQLERAPVEFSLRWIRRGKVVGIACVDSDNERQLLFDLVEYLNDYRHEQGKPEFRVIKWPLPEMHGPTSNEDLSLVRAKQFLGQFARAEFTGDELVLLVGDRVKNLMEEIDARALRIEIDKFPDNAVQKLEVWKQMLLQRQ